MPETKAASDEAITNEPIIDAATFRQVQRLQLSEQDAADLERRWNAWLADGDREELRRSLALQRAQIKERLSRAADLAIDGTLTREEYRERKLALELELAQVAEREEELDRDHLDPAKRAAFLELMKNVAGLYEIANPAERRQLAANSFSNCRVVGKNVEVEPSNWLIERDPAKLSPLVTQIDTLLEFL